MNIILFSKFQSDDISKTLIINMSKNGADSRICCITNSKYFDKNESNTCKSLISMGFKTKNIEVINIWRDINIKDIVKLHSADIVIIDEGNAFEIQKNLSETGIYDVLKALSLKGVLLIGIGTSSVLMSKNIDMAQFPDEDYINFTNHNGLNLTDIEVKPHFQNCYGKFDVFVEYSKHNNQKPIYCLEDNMCVAISNNIIKTYGEEPIIIKSGHFYYQNERIED